jgi:hypothetical protein
MAPKLSSGLPVNSGGPNRAFAREPELVTYTNTNESY